MYFFKKTDIICVMTKEDLLVLLSTPLYTIIIGLEMLLSSLEGRRFYSWQDTLTNLYLMFLNLGLELLTRFISFAGLFYFFHLYDFQVQPNWMYWLMLIFGVDFCYYWLHRMNHEVRLFWAVHVTHHSSDYFNLTVGFRSSVFETLYRFIFYIPLALLGFHPLDIYFIHSLLQIYGILVHTQYVGKLGWLEYVLVTPSHHRVHHASNVRYLDKNIGMTFIWWDKMFGTFEPERPNEPIEYGLTKPLEDRGPVNILMHEWRDLWRDVRRAPDWSTALRYLFNPPGWSPDGSTLTSKQLQAQLGASEQAATPDEPNIFYP
jgi:sterol desaturase/sphingolipid hydroxylase (fatty acid hydroxylase superfamily)